MPEKNDKQNTLADGDMAEVIHLATAAAIPRNNPHEEGDAYAVVPPGHAIQYLTRPSFPRRHKGTVQLNDVESFLTYWDRHATGESMIYGSISPAQIIGVFNDHGAASDDVAPPGWRDFRANFTLQHSREWMVWTKRNGQVFDGNAAFAAWLEDNLLDISKPDPAKFMDIAMNFKASQATSISQAVNLTNGQIDLTYANIVEASSQSAAGRKVSIPEKFEISVPVFSGFNQPKYAVTARFRYKVGSGTVSLRYELERPHKVEEQAFKDLLDQIEKKTKRKVLFGSPG